MPGRYFVPSRAKESLEVWSMACTAAEEKTGFNTNCVTIDEFMGLSTTRTLPYLTLMSSKEGSIIS